MMSRERDKLETALGGIKDMGGVPDLVFVIDTNKEALAIKEANRLKIRSDRGPRHQFRSGRHYLPGPGERRRRRRSNFIAISSPARRSMDSRGQGAHGVDLGEAETRVVEPLPEVTGPEASATDRFDSWRRRAARRTIWPNSLASARRSSRSSTNMGCSIIGSSPG